MQRNGELSVEEILESIKKVIARDNKDSAQSERYRRETQGVVLRGPGSNFGLIPVANTGNDDEADEASSDDDLAREYELNAEEDAEVLDLGAEATELPDDEAAEPDDLPVASDLGEDTGSEPLDLQETEEEQPVDAFPAATTSEISQEAPVAMSESSDSPFSSAAPAGETPIERMVRESLRPMLREWLDTNLPPIVEQMVKTELERIMGKSN